ncbi:MAG: hypothetical protein WDZ74_02420 [Candidatus Paceibacterota bacterium]
MRFVDFLLRYSGGIIKNKQQASWVVLSLAIGMILVAIFLLTDIKKGARPVDPEKIPFDQRM